MVWSALSRTGSLRASSAEPPPSPGTGAASSGTTFVGRDHEIAILRAAFAEAREARGRVVLLSGDPGIGKTRLVNELVARLGRDGSEAHWGRCSEGSAAPAFWPWAQVLRSCLRAHPAGDLPLDVDTALRELGGIVPELAVPSTGSPGNVAADPADARTRLFASVTRLLRARASEQPLVVVLDDLHRADAASLLLLQFVASDLRSSRILVLGTYRDVELEPHAPLARLLADLDRHPFVSRLVLGGLSPADVHALAEERLGATAARGAVRAVWECTHGNPLFVEELLRLEESDALALRRRAPARLPHTIREAITRRLAGLAPHTRELLRVAAIAGRDFDVTVLAQVAATGRARLDAALDEARRAELVSAVPGEEARIRFAHVLDRDVLFAETTPEVRAELHRRWGESLESLHRDRLQPHLAVLAHHFFESSGGTMDPRALEYSVAAARQARAALAYEEAVEHYRRALLALTRIEPQPARECELRLALGEAQRCAGHLADARASFDRVSALARAHRLPAQLARAALARGEPWVMKLAEDAELIALLDEALTAVGRSDDVLRARLLAGLAWVSSRAPCRRRESLSSRAVALASRARDSGAMQFTLTARYFALWSTSRVERRVDVLRTLLQKSVVLRDHDTTARAHLWLARDLLEVGAVRDAWVHLELGERLAGDVQQTRALWQASVLRSTQALLERRFADAERLSFAALECGNSFDPVIAAENFHAQMMSVERAQGRSAALIASLRQTVAQRGAVPVFRCALAALCAEIGDTDSARGVLEERPLEDLLAEIPTDFSRIPALTLLAEAVVALADRGRAERVVAVLSPFASYNVVGGSGATCDGAVARRVGELLAVLERWQPAADQFEHALRSDATLGSPWQLARTQVAYARMLLARDRPGDRQRASDLVSLANRTAECGGPPQLIQAVAATGLVTTPVSGATAGRNRIRRQGAAWSVRFAGTETSFRDLKGFRYIAYLVRHPGTEVHAAALAAWAENDSAVAFDPAAAHVALGDCGPALDATARDEYRRRLRDLADDLDDAERANDLGRQARLRHDIDHLSRELARAFDGRGRPRLAASVSERARISVRNDITRALRAIAPVHPDLARHLDDTIRTGTYCVYLPPNGEPWDD